MNPYNLKTKVGVLDILAARCWAGEGSCLPWGQMKPLVIVCCGKKAEGVGNRFASV